MFVSVFDLGWVELWVRGGVKLRVFWVCKREGLMWWNLMGLVWGWGGFWFSVNRVFVGIGSM